MVRETPLLGSLKTCNITYQTPQETLQGTPTTLPTSEPGTPQIGYTVASGDLPTLSVIQVSLYYFALLYGAGKFVTAGTLSWRMKKNGASVATGTASVAANTYYTVNACFVGVAVGDLLELALWSNQTDSNWDYNAYFVACSRLKPFSKKTLLANVSIATPTVKPALTLGNPQVNNVLYSAKTWFNPAYGANQFAYGGPFVFYYFDCGTTYGMFQQYPEINLLNAAVVYTNATYRPKYYCTYMVTQVSYRGVLLPGMKID